MSTILLPIKPKYVYRILENKKCFEFRKSRPNRKVTKMILYATSPVKKALGEVEVLGILEDSPKSLWEKTKQHAGADQESFERYFYGKKIGYAYQLGKVTRYSHPKSLQEFGINFYPQTFVYLDKK